MPAARKPSPKDVAADVDDLLAPDVPDVPDEVEAEEEMTPEEAAEVAALEAELAKPETAPEPAFVPYEKLSPAQKKIRDLRDAVAQRAAAEAERAPIAYGSADGDGVRVHVLEDGFTACGVVWYRGQEIFFPFGGEAYEQTKDRDGNSWLDLDEAAQWRRWGKKMFGLGAWPGQAWGDTTGIHDPEEIAAVKAAAAREARRRGSAPIIR